MDVLRRMAVHDYEQILFCNDNSTGLRAIIAIHSTRLGPALGGVRMRPYPTEAEALEDVLRLARGMTYKAAISGCNLGGGKSVVIGDPTRHKNERVMRALGRAIDRLGGNYIAGQDIGTNSHDMAIIRQETRHVSCVNQSAGGAGDPSFSTAWGVVCGIRAVLKQAYGDDSLDGRHVAVQGAGHVGYHVVKYCTEAGARVTISDLDLNAAQVASNDYGASVVTPDFIYEVKCDVFSPCAIGGIINDRTVPLLNCRGICGGANNVLAEARHAVALQERQIWYAPDYLANSGGLIRCQDEVRGIVDDDAVRLRVARIYDQVLMVFARAAEENVTTAQAADRIAEERINAGSQPIFVNP